MNLFNDFNKVYEACIVLQPAGSCVAVKFLPRVVLVEIEVVAIIKK